MTRRTTLILSMIVAGVLYGFWKHHSWRASQTPPPPPGWHHIPLPTDVYAMVVDGDTVWAAGKTGLFRVSRKDMRSLDCRFGPPELSYVRAMAFDSATNLWIGHMSGLSRIETAGMFTFTEKDGLPDRRINSLLVGRDGKLRAGTWGGLATREDNTWKILKKKDGLADDMVNVMVEHSSGAIILGSYVAPQGGISVVSPSGAVLQTLSTANGIPHNNITSLHEMPDASVWVATGLYNRGGAARIAFTDGQWKVVQTLQKTDGLAGEKVRSVFRTSDGALWFGSEYDGLARFDPSSPPGANSSAPPLVFTVRNGLIHPEIKCMLQDVDGKLWIGTMAGVTVVDCDALRALSARSRN